MWLDNEKEHMKVCIFPCLVCYLASCEDLVTKAGCLDMLFSCWTSWESTKARRHGSSLVTTWISALISWSAYIMKVLFYPSMTCHFLLNCIYSKVYRFWLDLAFENEKAIVELWSEADWQRRNTLWTGHEVGNHTVADVPSWRLSKVYFSPQNFSTCLKVFLLPDLYKCYVSWECLAQVMITTWESLIK